MGYQLAEGTSYALIVLLCNVCSFQINGDTNVRRVCGVKQAVSVAAGPEHTLVLSLTSYPSLPLHDLYQEYEPLNGEQQHLLADPLETNSDDDEDGYAGFVGRYRPTTMLDATPSDSENITWDDFDVNAQVGYWSQPAVADNSVKELPVTLSVSDGVPSLKDFCQMQLAKAVNCKTVFNYLIYAEFYDAPLLTDYCAQFIRMYVVVDYSIYHFIEPFARNFDALLVQLKPSEIIKIIEALPDLELPPVQKMEDLLVSTSTSEKVDTNCQGSKAAPSVSNDIKVCWLSVVYRQLDFTVVCRVLTLSLKLNEL